MSEYKPTPIKSSPFRNDYFKAITMGPLGLAADKMGIFDPETYDGRGSYKCFCWNRKPI